MNEFHKFLVQKLVRTATLTFCQEEQKYNNETQQISNRKCDTQNPVFQIKI